VLVEDKSASLVVTVAATAAAICALTFANRYECTIDQELTDTAA